MDTTQSGNPQGKDKDKKKSGGQPGNQNARKHGLYTRHMNKKERQLFEEAKSTFGNKNEKALLRIKLDAYVAQHPDDLVTMARIVKALEHKW